MTCIQKYCIALTLLVFGLDVGAAPLTIQITQGVEQALPIAVVPFGQQGAKAPPDQLADIVRADLFRTGRFKTMNPKDMLSKPVEPMAIKYQNWRMLDIEALVIGNVTHLGADRYNISFWLFDVYKQKQLKAFNLETNDNNYRAAAHKVSDIIYEALIGEPGAFSTRIAYITAKMDAGKPLYSLWMADSDGFNAQILLNSREPIMSPTWSPDGSKIAYASLEENSQQRIFIQDWASGKRERLNVPLKGLLGAPSWSPNGKKLAFTNANDGNAEIYVLDLASKKLDQITSHWAIDTEAVWTPDGASIIFTSDRGGRPQLYQVAATGGRVTRLTFEGKENARAAVSPDGKRIAMVNLDDGKFRIGVLELGTGHFNLLTDGPLDESPSFAPNGSMIIYATTKGNRGELAAVSVDGRVRQSLAYEDEVREPAWSPINNK